MEQILRRIVVGGIYIIPFLVLLVTGSLFFPYITGKNFAFRLITEVVFFAWLALAFLNSEYRPKWNWLLVSITAFVGITFIADIFGVYSFKSLWSNFERMEGFVTIAHLYAYFLVLISVFKEKEWQKYFSLWLVAAALVCGYALLQIAGLKPIHQGGVRLDATFGNATYLAVFMLMTSFLAAYKSWKSDSRFKKRMYAALVVLELFILYYTATRGAILGLVGGVGVFALLLAIFERENARLRKAAIGAIVGVLVLIGGFFLIKDTAFVRSSPVLGRFASISLEDTTTKSRFMVWNMALRGFKEKPLLGWGQENFNYVFNKYYNPNMYGQEQWFDRTHNVVLDWLVAGGLLGALSYLSMFTLGCIYLWKSQNLTRLEKSLFTGLLSAYFINNLFVFDSLGGYLLFFMLLSYIHYKGEGREWLKNDINDKNIRNIIVPVMAVALVLTIYKVNAYGYSQGRMLIRALSAPSQGNLAPKMEGFKETINKRSFGTAEAREYLSETANQLKAANVPTEQKRAFYNFAFNELNNQIRQTPSDARHYVFAGSLAFNYGDATTSLKYFEEARKLSPNKQAILFGIGSAYLAQNETDKAIAILKQAHELAPAFEEARAIYAIALVYGRNYAEAERVVVMPEGNVVFDRRLAEAYLAKGEPNRALSYLRAAKETNRKKDDVYLALASLYLDLDRNLEAIAILEEGIENIPEFKTEAQYYIDQIKKE